MTLLQSIILGIVEGLTEFLPVSSTYHLLTISRALALPDSEFLHSFEVIIQGGSILALLALYLHTFLSNRRLSFFAILSFLPTGILGYVLYCFIKATLFTTPMVSWLIFVLVGLLFLWLEYLVTKGLVKPMRLLTTLTWQESLLIGVIQATSVVPGVSRAGSVIVGMMLLGFRRDQAATYTFLLSLPTILIASGYDLFRHPEIITSSNQLLLLIVGLCVSFISAYSVMRWFITFLQSHSLVPFGYYRLALAILILLTLGI